MIILDTNVISEAMKVSRQECVVEWLDRQSADTLFLTCVSLSELSLGIEILPLGRRKDQLKAGLNKLLVTLFSSRILPFDREAALMYGVLVSKARKSGKAISIPDGQIAAIAKVHDFKIATRDTVPFVALGQEIINPWHS